MKNIKNRKGDEVLVIVNGKFYTGDMEFTYNPMMAKLVSPETAEALRIQFDDSQNQIEIITPLQYFSRERRLKDQIHALQFRKRSN